MKMLNLFGKSVVSVAVLANFCGANAAPSGRASMMPSVNTGRMPTMPTVSLNTIGNPAVTTMSQPVINAVTVNPTPTPTPDPKPSSECQDGGVKNSTYTVSMCMNDVLQCINTGALQGGLHDMFNEDVRNSIMNGMKLCQAQIDKCIRDVRVDCRNVYASSNDVWLDFNSRIVQPEYYNFVLRKTGLTPNQAENTCLLLDRNTYGTSFAAVSDVNAVNTEYKNKVGAYNESLSGTLSKDNPQGVAVNTVGYDGNRGHYARWDAVNAECLVRVAAYNKDKLITNSWLFGAVGNDNPAEVWQKAGSTFTCDKKLFDFNSLLNDTKTAAVIAVPGGAVLGGAIGAAAGAGAYAKKHQAYEDALNNRMDPCADESYRVELANKIVNSGLAGLLKTYAFLDWNRGRPRAIFDDAYNFFKLKEESEAGKCRELRRVFEKIPVYESVLAQCDNSQVNEQIMQAIVKQFNISALDEYALAVEQTQNGGHAIYVGGVACGGTSMFNEQQLNSFLNSCQFKPLQSQNLATGNGVLCEGGNGCLLADQIKYQINELRKISSSVSPLLDEPEDANKGKEIGKGVGIGVATGAAAGGVATAITAFVERSNISCKVGDGLNSVSLGKAHTIDSLKDFYVKWNLHLPDTVSPTSAVSTRADWEQACSQFNGKLADCPKVQINLKDTNGKYTLVPSACKVSGTICIADNAIMTSNGIK